VNFTNQSSAKLQMNALRTAAFIFAWVSLPLGISEGWNLQATEPALRFCFLSATPAMAPNRKRTRKTPLIDNDTVDNQQQADSPATRKKQKVNDAKDGQKARSGSIIIPVDEYCPLNASHKVHVDDEDGTIFDVLLNQTNASNNNNKFYRIQLLSAMPPKGEDYRTWTRWGRVGESGQSKLLGDSGSLSEAMNNFQVKFKDKTGHKWEDRTEPAKKGKYTYLERSYEDSSDEGEGDLPGASKRQVSKGSIGAGDLLAESKLPGPVQRLMGLIFNQQYFDQTMADFDYDANKMPLGKLSKKTLKKGYETLKELAAAINDVNSGTALETLSNQYFSLIPHDFARRRPPVLREMSIVQKEIDLLENLTDMRLANDIMKSAKAGTDSSINLIDRQYEALGMQEMTPLGIESQEFVQLRDYLKNSAGYTHNLTYKVHDIFRIERSGETKRFLKSKHAKIPNSDRRLLWHGSRCTNFGGILSQGLRIAPPEAPVSGYMFGKGVYLADISTKSANYCWASTSGNVGLLLLCEVELGKPPLELTTADYNAAERAQESNRLSTLGLGRTAPAGWKDAGCVHQTLQGVSMPDVTTPPKQLGVGSHLMYNEYIVYDVAQIRLRYLLRVEITGGH
jgi:poly [ADP-ribose] polymerase 2/3/4